LMLERSKISFGLLSCHAFKLGMGSEQDARTTWNKFNRQLNRAHVGAPLQC
jgi:hypothetical protein